MLKKLPEVPAALRELITSNAEGNPFYMEELVRMLIDQGAIRTRTDAGDVWQVDAERLLVAQVPSTLTGVLQARLDGLPAAEKLTLQAASVIGPVFWDRALMALDAQAGETLPALVRRELALPRADADLDGLREYAFRHQVLHQVTYDTVLKKTRRALHAKVAHWLAAQTGLRAGNFLGATAEHYERAGDAANAAEFHARAAEHALQRFGHDAVLAHVGRAVGSLGNEPDPLLRWRLLDVREQTLDLQGRRDEQSADIDAMERLAEVLGDDRKRAHVAGRRCRRALRMGDWAEQERAARRSLQFAERAGDDGLRLHALRQLASSRIAQGDIEGGRALAAQGLEEVRRLGLRANESLLLNTLAVAANCQGDAAEMLELNRQALGLFRELGDRRGEGVGLSNQGVAWLNLGNLAQARRDLEEALRIVRSTGDRVMECSTLASLSALALVQGEDARTLTLARAALEIAVATQARDKETNALIWLGNAELARGRHAAARQVFERARALAVEIENSNRHDAAAGLARVALDEGDADAARHAVEPVLVYAAGGGALDGAEEARLIEWTCHRALAAVGDPRADAWLTRAHDALQAQAGTIADPGLRQGFLQNVPWHREIVAAWAARGQKP